MAALRELFAQFDVKIGGVGALTGLNKQLDDMKDGLLGNIGRLSTLGTAVASAFALHETKEFFKTQMDLGSELDKTSVKTGLSLQMLQKLQYAAYQADVSSEQLAGSLGKLQLQLGGGIAGKGGPAIAALQKMKIETKDATQHTRPLADILLDVSEKVTGMTDANERVAASVQLFGKSGKELLPFLMKGKEGIQGFMKEADELGFALGPDFVEAAGKGEESSKRLEWSWRAFKGLVATELFPTFKNFVDMLTKGVGWFKELAKHTTIVSSGLTGLSILAGIKLFGSLSKLLGLSKGGGLLSNLFGIGKLALILGALAVLYLAWDDVFGLFTGKKSEIGSIIDDMYGKGRSTDDVNSLKAAWNGVWSAITGAYTDSISLSTVWDTAVGLLKASWGDFTDSVLTTLTLILRAGQTVMTFATQATNIVRGKPVDQKAMSEATNGLGDAWKRANLTGILRANPVGEIGMVINDAAHGRFGNTSKIEAGPKAYGVDGGGIGPPRAPIIHQTNHIHGGDPAKVQAAINQGTSDALSQNDLRHGLNAVKSRAPAVQ